MTCPNCGTLIPAGSRRDRVYCTSNCSALASYYRRKSGAAPPPRWQHPALGSASVALRAAADRARQLGDTHGWSPSTIRLIVSLAAVHAARWAAIRDLTLDDLDLPNRRITIAGHRQRLGELTHRTLRAWLGHRRATWPYTPNRHVLISGKTALGTGPVSKSYLNWNLQRYGVSIERIRRDRVLHEALTACADPLHLALVFGLSHTTASRYTLIACDLLADQPAEVAGEQLPRGCDPRRSGAAV